MHRGLRTVFRMLKSAYEFVQSIKQLSYALTINYSVIQKGARTFA
jgi:hypothetical protein